MCAGGALLEKTTTEAAKILARLCKAIKEEKEWRQSDKKEELQQEVALRPAKPTTQLRNFYAYKEEEDQLLSFESNEASSRKKQSSEYLLDIEDSFAPEENFIRSQNTGEMLQKFSQENDEDYMEE